MKYPFTLACANGFTIRGANETLQVLCGERQDGRVEGGTLTIAPGGYIDHLKDYSALHTAIRETGEETGAETEPLEASHDWTNDTSSILTLGPVNYKYRWNPETQRAFCTGEIIDNPPLMNHNYLLRYIGGTVHDTKELANVSFRSLKELLKYGGPMTWQLGNISFDQALVLEKAIARLRTLGLWQ